MPVADHRPAGSRRFQRDHRQALRVAARGRPGRHRHHRGRPDGLDHLGRRQAAQEACVDPEAASLLLQLRAESAVADHVDPRPAVQAGDSVQQVRQTLLLHQPPDEDHRPTGHGRRPRDGRGVDPAGDDRDLLRRDTSCDEPVTQERADRDHRRQSPDDLGPVVHQQGVGGASATQRLGVLRHVVPVERRHQGDVPSRSRCRHERGVRAEVGVQDVGAQGPQDVPSCRGDHPGRGDAEPVPGELAGATQHGAGSQQVDGDTRNRQRGFADRGGERRHPVAGHLHQVVADERLREREEVLPEHQRARGVGRPPERRPVRVLGPHARDLSPERCSRM